MCTFGAALWRFKMYTSPCNVTHSRKKNIFRPVTLKSDLDFKFDQYMLKWNQWAKYPGQMSFS